MRNRAKISPNCVPEKRDYTDISLTIIGIRRQKSPVILCDLRLVEAWVSHIGEEEDVSSALLRHECDSFAREVGYAYLWRFVHK